MAIGRPRLLDIARLLLVLCLLVLAVWGVLLTDRPEVRYQEYPRQFHLIYGQRGPVDLAIFGNSRARRAIVAEQLVQQLVEANFRFSGSPVLYECACNWRGQEHQYVLVRDLLEHRPNVERILIEYNLNPGRTRRYHPHTPFTARVGDLADIQTVESETSAVLRGSLLLKQILNRTTLRVEQLITRHWTRLARHPVQPARTTDCTHSTDSIRAEDNLGKRKRLGRKWRKRPYRWKLEGERERINEHYTRAMIRLAQRRGVRVALFMVPRLYNAPFKPGFREEVEKHFGIPFLVPPVNVLEKLYEPGAYRDPTHMTPKGSRIYARWLARELCRIWRSPSGSDEVRPPGPDRNEREPKP